MDFIVGLPRTKKGNVIRFG